jgi:hypothetical protein
MSETDDQIAVVEYCELRGIPIVHIPNESKRSVAYGAMLKRMGMRKGFPDLFVTLPRLGYHGLFIEMKTDKGKLSNDQRIWLTLLKNEGYLCRVCRSVEVALEIINKYVYGGKQNAGT